MRRLCALLLASLILCACTRVTVSGTHAELSNGGMQPGVLRLAYVQEPSSLNPLPLEGAVGFDIANLIYSSLWTIDDKGHFFPDLAISIPTIANGGVSGDGRAITVHLQHGVVWHDGAPLTSHDIAFTLQAFLNEKNILPTREYYEPIASIDTPDDYTAVFHLKHPYGVFYYAASAGCMPILPAHLLAKYADLNRIPFNTHPVGSGPFEVVEWVHGDHITLRGNTRYWRGPPKLRTIILKIIPDSNTIVTQLQTHELDAWLRADRGAFPVLASLHGFHLFIAPANSFATVDFNIRDPILADVRVRRAIASAIDRDRLIRSTVFGLAHPIDADQSRQSWAYNPNVPHIAYNPTTAQRLLDQAGWVIGTGGNRFKAGQQLTLQIAVSSTPQEARKVAAVIQTQLRAIGIDTSMKVYSRELLNARVQNGGIMYSGRYQTAVEFWQPNDDPDDYSGYGCAQFAPVGQNWNFWCDRRADAAMRDGQRTLDQARRKRDYGIVQEEIATQLPALFLWQSDRIDVLSDHFHGYTPSYDASGIWNAWQWSMDRRAAPRRE